MLADCKTLDEYVSRYQVDGVLWKAEKLLAPLSLTDIRRNESVETIARTLALIPEPVYREGYIKTIAKEYSIVPKTLMKLVDNHLVIVRKKDERKVVKKNKVSKLEGDATTYDFFSELVKKTKNDSEFQGIKIDKLKFCRLLSHFGFSRYEAGTSNDDDKFNFIRLNDNVIQSVTRNKIIDFVENFIFNEYNFEKAGCKHTDPEVLINTLYEQNRTIFSKDLFARVRTQEPIVISMDKQDTTFFYFKNGFVEVNKDGYNLRQYEEMNGSVWETQMLSRDFKIEIPEVDLDASGNICGSVPDENGNATNVMKAGYFADFCWHVANCDMERFQALCTIIGYLTHDYYEYTLKAVEFTDSTVSEASEGRTGKTLLMKMAGHVRSFCEIPGKTFKQTDEKKYQLVSMGTQLIHLNDVNNKGRDKFEFELMFNDITEGIQVRAMYMAPFMQRCKIAISTNKSLDIEGPSMRARIVEFEMGNFFNEHNTVNNYYGQWFGRDWDEKEWSKFDNFMCYCAMTFHANGLLEPAIINLGERKLLDHTAPEFVEFMTDIQANLKSTGIPFQGYTMPNNSAFQTSYKMPEFVFDKKQLFDRFQHDYIDFKAPWMTVRRFNKWLVKFSETRLQVRKPKETKSNGIQYIQFIPDDRKE
jgi:hypothetical protein